jgi:hypothetical protein
LQQRILDRLVFEIHIIAVVEKNPLRDKRKKRKKTHVAEMACSCCIATMGTGASRSIDILTRFQSEILENQGSL